MLALVAVVEVVTGDARAAFLALYGAVIVDATDGWLARRADVATALPGIDGRRLDDIVDYVTFVFVPAVVLVETGRLPEGWSLWLAAAMLVASAFGFARVDAKADDHFFIGFPSYWNVVAFYVYVGGAPRALNAAVVLALCVMVFVPVGYLYPSRTPAFRSLTVGLGVAWGALVLVLVLQLPAVSPLLVLVSLAYPVYYAALSFRLHRHRTATSIAVGPSVQSSQPARRLD